MKHDDEEGVAAVREVRKRISRDCDDDIGRFVEHLLAEQRPFSARPLPLPAVRESDEGPPYRGG
ncbi:MAG: hypothetical protein FJ265_02495 [Planctomycetes bacterium]|nr:hypothetical protein [Planctomycetota bacterium]